PDALRELDGDALEAAEEELRRIERETVVAMAPYDRQLRELRARAAQIATERRRRERAERHAARMAVREQAKAGQMPTLGEALEAPHSPIPDDAALSGLGVFLATGGEVRLGYPTRPGTMTFTDGRGQRSAATWGEARSLYAEGLEPGTTALPGVRVHLVGTRIEKVLPAGELLLGGPAEAG
ncbi:MAG: hypothetical protein ABR564_08405, partial [Candidatus Dormibacteria bacterium]